MSKVLELNKKDNGWFAFVSEAKRVSLKSFVFSLGAVYNTDSEETVSTYSLNLAVGINQLVRSGVIDTGLALQTLVGHTAADMAVAYVKALKSWRRRASSKTVDDVAMKCIVDFFVWFEPKTLTRLAFAEDLATVLRKRSTSAVYQLMEIGLDALDNSGGTHGDCFVLLHYVLSVIAETNGDDDVVDLDALAIEIEDEFEGAIESEDSPVGGSSVGVGGGGGGGGGAGGSGAEGKEASASAGTEAGGGHGSDGSAECAASATSSASGGSGMCPKKVVWMAMVYSGLWAQKKKDCHVLFNDMAKKCFSRPELLTKAMVEEYAHHVPMLTTGSLHSLDLVMHAAQKLRGGAGGEDESEAREEQEVREVQHAAREVEVERLSSIEVVELVYSVLVRLKSPLLDDSRAKKIWAVMHKALDEDEDDEDMDDWLRLATLLFRQPFDVWKTFGVSMARGLLSLEEKLDGVREDAGEALESLESLREDDPRVRRDAVFVEVYHLLVGSAGGGAGALASNKRQRLNDDKDSGEESGESGGEDVKL